MIPSRLRVHSRRGAYVALALLTLVWGLNWIVMKAALAHANPLVLNAQRTCAAAAVLFAALIARRGRMLPHSWRAVIVTGTFQTTVNFGATMLAVAGGGAGKASVLVFTMPFWTLLIAWPVLHERIRGLQIPAIAFAFGGLVLVVAPWAWHGDVQSNLWAIASGFGWGAGTVALKHYQRDRGFDMLPFIAWQMALGALPLAALPWIYGGPATQWSVSQVALFLYMSVISSAGGFLVWMTVLRWLPAGTASLNMFASPVIALLASMAIFGERLAPNEWQGIALIGIGLALITIHALVGSRRRGSTAAPPSPVPLD
ncbi:MAG: EamA family transporter [Betaproteobacteria bacterium]|nr:EamA family transporter [Betaproteobacteria bacterium]